MHKEGMRYNKGRSTIGNALTVVCVTALVERKVWFWKWLGVKLATSIGNSHLKPVLLQMGNKERCWLCQLHTMLFWLVFFPFLRLRIWFRWNFPFHHIQHIWGKSQCLFSFAQKGQGFLIVWVEFSSDNSILFKNKKNSNYWKPEFQCNENQMDWSGYQNLLSLPDSFVTMQCIFSFRILEVFWEICSTW